MSLGKKLRALTVLDGVALALFIVALVLPAVAGTKAMAGLLVMVSLVMALAVNFLGVLVLVLEAKKKARAKAQ